VISLSVKMANNMLRSRGTPALRLLSRTAERGRLSGGCGKRHWPLPFEAAADLPLWAIQTRS